MHHELSLPFDRPEPLNPPREYDLLRKASPVARVGMPDGSHAWLVTSFDAAAAVLSDPRFGVTAPGVDVDNPSLLQDGDAHTRLRRLVSKAFTPKRISELTPSIRAAASNATEQMVNGGRPADLVGQLAAPLSIGVISDLLGVAADDVGHLRSLADTLSAADPFASDVTDDEIVAVVAAWEELNRLASELVALKRSDLGSDLMSELITVHDDRDGRLDDAELVSLVATIVAAGYRTSTTAIAIGTIRLIAEGALAGLADDPQRRSVAVDEVLRLHAGQVGEPFPRYAHHDVQLDGASISHGDVILVKLEAAHRDPERFDQPNHFDPGRTVPHMAFGRGPHYCLGAALARAELDASFAALSRTVPGLRLHGTVADIDWVRGIDAAPESVLVTW